MNTRGDIIRTLREGLGPRASREDAKLLWDRYWAADVIQWDDLAGYVLPEGLDFISDYEAAPVLSWRLQTPGGLDFGVWPGRHAQDAYDRMVAEAGGPSEDVDGADLIGAFKEWTITPEA